MKLWLIEARNGLPEGKSDDPWCPRWDKHWDTANGFVVRSETEGGARLIAAECAGDEAHFEGGNPWLNRKYSRCRELKPNGKRGLVLRDFSNG